MSSPEFPPSLTNTLNSLAAALPGTAGVVIKDLTTGRTLTLNEHEPFPAASIIKLPILWAFFEQVEAGQVTADERITLSAADQVGGSGVLYTLAPGLNLTLLDLATLMITVSDNTATNILIDRLGLDAIGRTIANLGLTNTQLQRKMFDYDRARLGFDNLTTPADTATLLTYLISPPHSSVLSPHSSLLTPHSSSLTPHSRETMLYMLEQQQFNERLSRELPNNDTIRFAHKTGTLSHSEHDAGILYIHNRPFILVALTKNLTHSADAAHFCGQLGRLVYDYCISA
jgi:beta-lactamase class A